MKLDIVPYLIDAPALKMRYFNVPWDSTIFGFPVVQIEGIDIVDGDPAPAFLPFEQWCHDIGCRLVCCRMPHDRLRESGFLERRGFRFIEMVYRPRFEDLSRLPDFQTDLGIYEAAADDLVEIENIARSAFVTGRFVLDERLDVRLANERYSVWVRNSFADPQHQVLKAVIDDRIAGFFIVESRPDGTAYWHLTAVSPDFQHRGVGKSLWKAMMTRHRDAGMRAVETTISAHNTPVMNLYATLGFRFGEADMTFHRTDDPLNV